MVAELLAIKIRSNQDIKGIFKDWILHDNLKILQYAYDMTLLLKKKTDLNRALREIGEFAKISGLNLNKQKSVSLWIENSNIKQRAEKVLHGQKKKKIYKFRSLF